MRIVLASKSPRRRELVAELYEKFDIEVADCDETLPLGMHPQEGVVELAVRKGRAVLGSCGGDALIISSDTLVERDGVALGKPADKDEARSMLRSLSGRSHNVHTGIAVHYREKYVSGVASTAVYFREISESEINAYVESGDPMDKAGAYGIQSGAGAFVEKIEGDYDTVVGLSLRLLKKLIAEVCEND